MKILEYEGKSEIRSSKAERNPNDQFRKTSEQRSQTLRLLSNFGLRPSFGFRVSDFGFRQRLPMKKILLLLTLCRVATAQTNNSFPLWPAGAPDALGKEDKDIPTLTPFLPESSQATGAAMIICPGGGY